jgi:hypothetical protein
MKFAPLLFDKEFFEERNFFRNALLLIDPWKRKEPQCW